jgi:hypothetical protein
MLQRCRAEGAFPRGANATVILAEGHDYRILATNRLADDAVRFAVISAPHPCPAHKPCSADIPVCGFAGHSCPAFPAELHGLATGKSPEPADRNVCATHCSGAQGAQEVRGNLSSFSEEGENYFVGRLPRVVSLPLSQSYGATSQPWANCRCPVRAIQSAQAPQVKAQAQVNLTTILPTFFPSKRPINAPTACAIPSTTVSLCFTLPARK